MLQVLSIGDLIEPGSYRFLSCSSRAVNLTDGKRALALAAPGADRGPLNIILDDLDLGSVESVIVEAPREGRGALIVDGQRSQFGSGDVFNSSLPKAIRGGTGFGGNLLLFGAYLFKLAPSDSLVYLLDAKRIEALESPFERRMAEHTLNCVRDALLWNRRRGISRLSGSGIGLAPSGDYFIAGFLLGLTVLENMGFSGWAGERRKVLEWTGLRDVVSTARLTAAARGHACESVHEVLAALDLGDSTTVQLATERLLRAGAPISATSRADTGVGLYITVREGLAGRLRGCSRTGRTGRSLNESSRLWS